MNLKPGEVWLVDLGLAAKMRPIIIVSRYDSSPPRSLVIYVPITKQNRGSAAVNGRTCVSSEFAENQ